MNNVINLSHGSGGRIAQDLIQSVFVQYFDADVAQHDQARLPMPAELTGQLAMSTDSFVISPRHFPGGDIGCLAVYGTVNDLAVGGANAAYLSCAFVIEEGFSIEELTQVCQSMAAAAQRCGVRIVTGDTKVVPKGHCEGLFINTTGVGFIPTGTHLDFSNIRAGDVIIVSGDIGRHGACVAVQRDNYGLSVAIESDCGPLNQVTQALLNVGGVKYMRDATRGGVAAVLNEIAESSGHKCCLEESALPISEAVESVCEVLGFNALHLANEGRLVAIVAPDVAEQALDAIKALPEGQSAAIIGEVSAPFEGQPSIGSYVTLRSYLGVETLLAAPAGELLPRIC